ncbi:uncharacterized protein LOC106051901 isoform X2 [Biomphalaria glabrata]|nr:uncharacterized protein LOC106051901 isoform X2 [Biomphalaria glabrata]
MATVQASASTPSTASTSSTSMPTENSDFTPVIMWVSVGVGCLLLISVAIVCFLKRHKLQVNRKFSVLYKRYFGFSLREAMKGNLPGEDNSVPRDDTDDKTCIYVNQSVINFKTYSEQFRTLTGSTKSTTSGQGEHIYSVCNYSSDVSENLEEPYRNIKPTIFSGTKSNISGRSCMTDNSSYVSLYDYDSLKFEPQFVEPTTPTSNVYGSSLDTPLNIYFNVDNYSSRNKTLARTERKFHEMKNALCHGSPRNIQSKSLDGSAKLHPHVHSHRLYVNCPNMVQLEPRRKHSRLQTISKNQRSDKQKFRICESKKTFYEHFLCDINSHYANVSCDGGHFKNGTNECSI